MMWYVSMRKKLSGVEYFLIGMIFPVCILLSLLSPILLPERIFNIVNKIFSNRLMLAEYYLTPENIKLFGNNLEKITTSMYTMDNAYVFAVVIYGIVTFAIMIAAYALVIYRFIKLEKNIELIMIVCFLIAGITEPFLFNTSFKNVTLVFIGGMLFENKRQEKEIAILNKSNYVIDYNYQQLYDTIKKYSEVWKKEKRRILLLAIAIGGFSTGIYAINVKMPKAYVVPRVHVDIASDETWYIDDVENSMYQDMKILDYKNSETQMQILEGSIVQVEYVRSCISTFLLATGVSGYVWFIAYVIVAYKRKI